MPIERLKHLEFLQAVITRHANTSFVIKGWSLTIVSAFFGFSVAQRSVGLSLVVFLPVLGFAWLDGYFVKQERLFRHLYEAAIAPETRIPMFAMDTQEFKAEDKVRWGAVVQSAPFWVFHGTILSAAVLTSVGLVITAVIEGHEIAW
jgi:hypothetical protein